MRKDIRKLTIDYADGTTHVVELVEGMFHAAHQNYPGGSFPKAEDGFVSHEIHWTDWSTKKLKE